MSPAETNDIRTDGESTRTRLNPKDWTSVVFSALALAVSIVSFYYSNIRVENSAIARIVEFTPTGDSSNEYLNGFVTAQTAFANLGNRPAFVVSATYQLSRQPNLDDGGFGAEIGADENIFPLLLPPREVRLVGLRIRVKDIINNYRNGAEVQGARRRFFVGFRFVALDSTGLVHESWTGMQRWVEVAETGWRGLGRIGNSTYPATKLLRD